MNATHEWHMAAISETEAERAATELEIRAAKGLCGDIDDARYEMREDAHQ